MNAYKINFVCIQNLSRLPSTLFLFAFILSLNKQLAMYQIERNFFEKETEKPLEGKTLMKFLLDLIATSNNKKLLLKSVTSVLP